MCGGSDSQTSGETGTRKRKVLATAAAYAKLSV